MSCIVEEEYIVDSLGIAMKGKLRVNSFKPSWRSADPEDLLHFLKLEVAELEEAIKNKAKPAHIRMECADVANMAAMIFDVAAQEDEERS